MKRQPGAVVIGVGLIVAGLWTIASALFPVISGRANIRLWAMPELWPVLLILVGAAMLTQAVAGHERQPGLVFLGVVALGLGLFFLLFTLRLGNLGWADMRRLWPVILIIVGFAFLLLYIADDMRNNALLTPAHIVGGLGLLALPVTLGLAQGSAFQQAFQLWPLPALIVALLAFFRPRRVESSHADSDAPPHD